MPQSDCFVIRLFNVDVSAPRLFTHSSFQQMLLDVQATFHSFVSHTTQDRHLSELILSLKNPSASVSIEPAIPTQPVEWSSRRLPSPSILEPGFHHLFPGQLGFTPVLPILKSKLLWIALTKSSSSHLTHYQITVAYVPSSYA